MNSLKRNKFIKSWGLLFVALLVSGLAFWLTINYLTSKEGSLREEILSEKKQKVRIIVAAKDLFPGDVINLETMALAFVDNANLSAFSLDPEQFGAIEGQIIEYPMSSGEPLLSHSISGQGIERFSDLLEENERAITLEIDSLNSASGMLVAGDFVDLMFLMDAGDDSSGGAQKNLRPLLQNVRILSVDAYSLRSKEQDFVIASAEGGAVHYGSVTVGVEYESAAKLVLARDTGDIMFMLRNKDDETLHDSDINSPFDFGEEASDVHRYQYFSANNSSANAPQLKNIIKSMPLPNKNQFFSQPIIVNQQLIKDDVEDLHEATQ